MYKEEENFLLESQHHHPNIEKTMPWFPFIINHSNQQDTHTTKDLIAAVPELGRFGWSVVELIPISCQNKPAEHKRKKDTITYKLELHSTGRSRIQFFPGH